MSKILVYNQNTLESKVISGILSSTQMDLEITLFNNAEKLIKSLDTLNFDLIIVDVEYFNFKNDGILRNIKRKSNGKPVLVCTFGMEKEVFRHIWRMEISDFLLKPYRPTWLVESVRILLNRGTEETEPEYTKHYLNLMDTYIKQLNYKKCINTAKEYIDFLHKKENNNIENIQKNSLLFAEGLAMIGKPIGYDTIWMRSGTLERFRNKINLQGKKYDSFQTYEKLIDMIFEVMDKEEIYHLTPQQKIINYVDRNIKQGISLDDAAEFAYMNSCYFSKYFKKITGENFITYVTDRKIEIAKQMLIDTDIPVINIAYKLSYSESNYFSKAFKRKVGVTPSEYRELSVEKAAV